MTTPGPDDGHHDTHRDSHHDSGQDDGDRETGPLGSATAPADDVASGGAPDGPASGQAGPSWPPAGSEPDAH